MKIEILKSDILRWKEECWFTYASQSLHGGRLQMLCDLTGTYKVMYNGTILYYGDDVENAIEAWEKV